jgi:hypothetical protein
VLLDLLNIRTVFLHNRLYYYEGNKICVLLDWLNGINIGNLSTHKIECVMRLVNKSPPSLVITRTTSMYILLLLSNINAKVMQN